MQSHILLGIRLIRSDSVNPHVFDARVVIGTKILSNFRAVGKKSVCWVKTIAIMAGLFVPNKSQKKSGSDYCIFQRPDNTQNCTAVYKTCSGK